MRCRCPLSAATIVAISLLVACGVPQGEVTVIDSKDLPAALRTPTTVSRSERPAGRADEPGDVNVYWIQDKLLVSEAITFESAPDVERVISLLERGPSNTEQASEVRSAVSQSEVVRGIARAGERVTVELSTDFAEVAGSDQVLALGQIVVTLTSVPGVSEVQFRRSGESLDVPVPDGSLVHRPVTRADYISLLSPESTKR